MAGECDELHPSARLVQRAEEQFRSSKPVAMATQKQFQAMPDRLVSIFRWQLTQKLVAPHYLSYTKTKSFIFPKVSKGKSASW